MNTILKKKRYKILGLLILHLLISSIGFLIFTPPGTPLESESILGNVVVFPLMGFGSLLRIVPIACTLSFLVLFIITGIYFYRRYGRFHKGTMFWFVLTCCVILLSLGGSALFRRALGI
ncbi:MAG: hypothetical protein LBR60_00320 [Fibrobacter sp.]|nr:hypothetical protein [Fibrobacter sp.]